MIAVPHVLAIDDSASVRAKLAQMVTDLGHEVAEPKDGAEAAGRNRSGAIDRKVEGWMSITRQAARALPSSSAGTSARGRYSGSSGVMAVIFSVRLHTAGYIAWLLPRRPVIHRVYSGIGQSKRCASQMRQ